MLHKIKNIFNWYPSYLFQYFHRTSVPLKHLFFAICDHYEPYWGNADTKTAQTRLKRWLKEYPPIAEKYHDTDGRNFVYSFFYPEEEYCYEDMEEIAKICRAGIGEVEIHLHHNNDTSENLRTTILDFKKRLANDHGLLSKNKITDEISYAFIHGNWALDNSRPDGKHCGVNDELTILQETGCYADLTMPSAPDITQTSKVNSIYYAIDDPHHSKSHDSGLNVTVGENQKGLLMIQGPLALNFKQRSQGFFPKIENGGLMASNPPSMERIQRWIDCRIHVVGVPDWGFVKIYTHGTQEATMKMLFDDGYLEKMIHDLTTWSKKNGCDLHFTSAREMTNIIFALEDNIINFNPLLRDYRYSKID